jgi:hypothetical protein
MEPSIDQFFEDRRFASYVKTIDMREFLNRYGPPDIELEASVCLPMTRLLKSQGRRLIYLSSESFVIFDVDNQQIDAICDHLDAGDVKALLAAIESGVSHITVRQEQLPYAYALHRQLLEQEQRELARLDEQERLADEALVALRDIQRLRGA